MSRSPHRTPAADASFDASAGGSADWLPPPPSAVRGRGAAENPTNRFERLEYVPEPDEGHEGDSPGSAEGPATVYLRDPTRTALATNQSPDVGFDTSLNPYRGCEHGCIYCLAPETPILHADMAWRPIADVREGDLLVGFDEHPLTHTRHGRHRRHGSVRKLRPARVEAVVWSSRPTTRLVTERADLFTTGEHRWLEDGAAFDWRTTAALAPGSVLRELPCAAPEREDDDYRAGYVAGLALGAESRSGASIGAGPLRVALGDRPPLDRLVRYLAQQSVAASVRPAPSLARSARQMVQVEIREPRALEVVDKLVHCERSSRSYRRGFVAGCFDAAGHNGASLRIFHADEAVLERVQGYGRSLGFDLRREKLRGGAGTIRLAGTMAERMRLFGVVRPAVERKMHGVFDRVPATLPARVEAVEPGPVRDVVDIQTSTGTFYAAGLATHNCYARPTHEYLGFSPGLDFETRILVKQDAPDLLRRELSARRFRPQVVGLSGVTDPYQPIERKLEITRRCLQVFADFRNPVTVITKSALVVRDVDLLCELAAHQAVSVNVSVTTLQPELHRVMEPRASHPAQRLRAIETLARAGIPVGVMVAPVIPALTDHEIPAILEAAGAAGARFASHIVVRLPYAVKDLFEAWLERHFPDRKSKVLNRVRAIRDGRLNDARFGSRMRGQGVYATQIHDLFELARKRHGFSDERPVLSTDSFRRPSDAQLSLFE